MRHILPFPFIYRTSSAWQRRFRLIVIKRNNRRYFIVAQPSMQARRRFPSTDIAPNGLVEKYKRLGFKIIGDGDSQRFISPSGKVFTRVLVLPEDEMLKHIEKEHPEQRIFYSLSVNCKTSPSACKYLEKAYNKDGTLKIVDHYYASKKQPDKFETILKDVEKAKQKWEELIAQGDADVKSTVC